MQKIIVVGGGLVGLSIAWRITQECAPGGAQVTILDPTPGRGASWVAGGMLTPVSEAWFGEEELLRLNLESLALWPAFAAELETFSDKKIGLQSGGTLHIALDADDLRHLERIRDFQTSLGLDVTALTRSELSRMEPFLTAHALGASFVLSDYSVDNRALVSALIVACQRSGVQFINERVSSFVVDGTHVVGVTTTSGLSFAAENCVLAAGAWSSELLNDICTLPQARIRPIKGEILRLHGPHAVISHTIRATVHGTPIYLVPRANGEIVVGATQLERGFDTSSTAGGVYELLRDAREVLPFVNEMDLLECGAGLRPGSFDNSPIIGHLPGVDGLIFASGHYRNGVLLTPITAAIGSALVNKGVLPKYAELVSLDRLGVHQ